VEIDMHCPLCRGKYETPSNCEGDDVIVHDVLSLREAYVMQPLLAQSDSGLSATDLRRKDRYVKTKTFDDLKDSALRLELYYSENGKKQLIPALDWDLLKNRLERRRDLDDFSLQDRPWNDPSLFLGLDTLMTVEEKAYVTELFVSGREDHVALAALILHGMMRIQSNKEHAAAIMAAVRQLTNLAAAAVPKSFAIDHSRKPFFQYSLWKRYPLPSHMPRCVSLPVTDPEGDISAMFNFQKDGLVLQGVRGPAGQAGLRRGDTVTHVNGEAVLTQVDVRNALVQAYRAQFSSALVVVNADGTTAQSLRERSINMKCDGLRHYM